MSSGFTQRFPSPFEPGAPRFQGGCFKSFLSCYENFCNYLGLDESDKRKKIRFFIEKRFVVNFGEEKFALFEEWILLRNELIKFFRGPVAEHHVDRLIYSNVNVKEYHKEHAEITMRLVEEDLMTLTSIRKNYVKIYWIGYLIQS